MKSHIAMVRGCRIDQCRDCDIAWSIRRRSQQCTLLFGRKTCAVVPSWDHAMPEAYQAVLRVLVVC